MKNIYIIGAGGFGREVADTVCATDMRPAEAARAVIAIADPKAKRAIAGKLGGLTIWETIIHPTAVVSPHAIIEAGTVIQANAFVSADAHIGGHCCVNCLSSIGHDAVLYPARRIG
jgi:acetyltransferase EpsM